MKIIIMGAGVVGTTAACVLAARGHEVTVIDRGQEAASECSFANGSQLSYSFANSWASPRTLSMLSKWAFSNEEAPLILPPYPHPSLWRWGMSFILNCSEARSAHNNAVLLRLGLYSKKKMEQLRTYTGVEFNNIREGNLHIFTEAEEFELGKKKAADVGKLGCKVEIASRERCLEIEPTLNGARDHMVGGIFAPLDESGDASLFSRELMEYCRREYNVRFLAGQEIVALQTHKQEVRAVMTNEGEVSGDAYVMALGSYSPLLLKQAGLRLPVLPVKGYSISFSARDIAPTVSITDLSRRVVHSTLGNRVRVAGIAEIAGYDTTIHEDRIEQVRQGARHLFPGYRFEELTSWACLRAMTPSGLPLIGKSKLDNLFLNTGHGTLGWSQAAGSAFLLADLMDSRTPEIPTDGLLPN